MRRNKAPIRKVLPDPKYGNEAVAKFINCIMLKGKKAVAEGIVYGAFDKLAQRQNKKEGASDIDPLGIFLGALQNIQPRVEVRSRRVGGATYQIPSEVRPQRAKALAMRWLIQAALKRSEKTMRDRLAGELLEAYEKRGAARKKWEDVQKMAEANKAFAHFSD